MSLPPLPVSFARGELSLPSTNDYTSLHQQQDLKPAGQVARNNKDDALASPSLPLPNVDQRMNLEPSITTRPQKRLPPRRRTSRAEQMISEVEDLYEFGISLSLFPNDPVLRDSLRKMKRRFRALADMEGSCAQRSAVDDTSDGSCQESEDSV
ncbi:hypothetical protein PMZ80_005146 [Knufia obscura]|uniref:Uncharacterized protein n=1 Tax=Knufia obscura TaxID=1635080 RepID=A0ABR0RPP8_9EURO|nr:hypothetical protein PMZ80_005146 [Knufia obscura]